ncbi:uncharacterized protein PgNI_00951 [Pyricularia grisea]|uniref:Uncharacterized protein n=1 Tax=Pyricularia grisea TaxID=148305 RepID=A0A6P8BLR5_PYRGI|nr:uncharacterized protein PgNI_00951 [Pyricularia grisea]TLD17634.1 hypothetical protein PgNI_00951 [Pyricularia grisea]
MNRPHEARIPLRLVGPDHGPCPALADAESVGGEELVAYKVGAGADAPAQRTEEAAARLVVKHDAAVAGEEQILGGRVDLVDNDVAVARRRRRVHALTLVEVERLDLLPLVQRGQRGPPGNVPVAPDPETTAVDELIWQPGEAGSGPLARRFHDLCGEAGWCARWDAWGLHAEVVAGLCWAAGRAARARWRLADVEGAEGRCQTYQGGEEVDRLHDSSLKG